MLINNMDTGMGSGNRIPMDSPAGLPDAAPTQQEPIKLIDGQKVLEFTRILQEYKSGRVKTEERIKAAEEWWKLRNTGEEQKTTNIGGNGFKSVSGWLHNVIVSKHADAMDAYPEAILRPRERGDAAEAQNLSSIVPFVLEANNFERTYSDAMWQKLKTGTGVYKIVWDKGKLNGLGDIGVERANLLNIYWEPGVIDIQRSKYFFHTELVDKEELELSYPELEGKLHNTGFLASEFATEEQNKKENKVTVIDVYYHKQVNGKRTLQYVKYVGDQILFATENDSEFAERGLYDHGLYPYVFDVLFPIEGSPCGYGYVDLCKNPQLEIDLLKTAFVKNAAVGAAPRYFSRTDGGVNEEEFLDTNKPLVHVNGNLGEDALRQIKFDALDGIYVSVLDRTIQELRETSGNTETATGNVQSGVTAASAIAALQEASGKGSRDSNLAAYRAYSQIVSMCIELIRQFYDLPRQFRITGKSGEDQFISYSNANLKGQPITVEGSEIGARLPVFDIKVSAQKATSYTRVAQNELAMQLYKLGFFNPQATEQALMCLDMMDFDGRYELIDKIRANGALFEKLKQYMQLALTFAQMARPEMVPGLQQDIAMTLSGATGVSDTGGTSIMTADKLTGAPSRDEHGIVTKAKARAAAASSPNEGGDVAKR